MGDHKLYLSLPGLPEAVLIWTTFTSGNGGLPDDYVRALAPGADGALWIGTWGGLGYFRHHLPPAPRIVDVIGEIGRVTQSTHTVAAEAFDSSYRTQPWLFHYVWRMTELGMLGNKPGPEIETKSNVYRATFEHDGDYELKVNAVDRNGVWSEPRLIKFKVALTKPDPLRAMLMKAAMILVPS